MSDYKRHTLVARLGPSDTAPVTSRVGDRATKLQFIQGQRRFVYGLGEGLAAIKQLGLQPPEVAIDLALLAACVTAADTRISRFWGGQDGWSREIAINLPVEDADLWSAQAGTIKLMLDFLTGDRWFVTFRPRPIALKRLAPFRSPNVKLDRDSVCLFSGGLDSFIGTIDLLEGGSRPVLTSQYDPTNSAYQRAAYSALKKRFGKGLPPRVGLNLRFPVNLLSAGSDTNLRARSFLFFAHATLVAAGLGGGGGTRTVFVPENGFISLNVPLDPLRIGAFSTRTTHPYYMARWNDLLKGLGLKVVLENPYQYATKGEMVRDCADAAFLASSAAATMSCSSPGKLRYQGFSPQHCGYCMPCLIRRGSLLAGMGQDPTSYHLSDLRAQPINTGKAEGDHIRSFQIAIERLRARPSLASTLIHLPGPLFDDPGSIGEYERVYRTGMAEVASLLAGVVARPL